MWLREGDDWFQDIWSRDYVVLDFETTNHDNGSALNENNELVTVCWFVCRLAAPIKRYYHDLRKSDVKRVLDQLWRDMTSCEVSVSHNVKFEAGWLHRHGYPVDELFWYDTMLAERSIISNRNDRLDLDSSVARRVPGHHHKMSIVSSMIKRGINPADIPYAPLKTYNVQDVELHRRLFVEQEELLKKEGLVAAACVKSILAIVLTMIEFRGLVLDAEKVTQFAEDTRLSLRLAQRELDSIVDLNVKSSQQKIDVLYNQLGFEPPIDPVTKKPYVTDKGSYATDTHVLSKLEAKTEEQKQFLSCLNSITLLRDLKSKYLDKLEEVVINEDKLLFTFSQVTAATHRLSSRGAKYKIQGQNIPRAIKNLFTAPKDYVVGEADHATIEYTVAGFLGQDEAALDDLINNVDAHRLTASIVFGGEFNPEESAKSEYNAPFRQAAKGHTFKPLYGGQSGTEKEVAYYKWFKEKHKGIVAEQNQWAESAVMLGYVKSPTGIKFYFPEARRTKYGNVTGFTKISNYCIQYFATGEISPIAVIFQYHMMRVLQMKSYIMNTVHDQSLTYVHKTEVDDYKELAEFCFVDCVKTALVKFYNVIFNYPIKVEVNTGTHWKM